MIIEKVKPSVLNVIKEVVSVKHQESWSISMYLHGKDRPSVASASLSIADTVPDNLVFANEVFCNKLYWFFNRLIVPEKYRNMGVAGDLLYRLENYSDLPILNYVNYYGSPYNIKTGKQDNGQWYLDWLERRGWIPNEEKTVFLFNPKLREYCEEDEEDEY